ncbi:DUF2004 domain-containing protein [Chitinophaga sp. Cy-1792]|uniref:DUF2004 domain-containing protein n=1 Tax=Chitinophaga sp. Cy-1792 TaxID=2608339 RepID=UPI00142220D0|nr:DUF2004 domain-containing protein [Chitinophaga sp. Cy-1792]NIG53673.1 DUF2004 domain-containing protein [Chitinophaga sp. Cy-1792]
MDGFELPYFGCMDSAEMRDYYIKATIAGRELEMDLHLENGILNSDEQQTLKHFLENLELQLIKNKAFIDEFYDEHDAENEVKFYIDFHKGEFFEELAAAINLDPEAADLDQQMIARLQLKRIGLTPKSNDHFAIFDYTIHKELTDYLLVIFTDAAGNINHITTES